MNKEEELFIFVRNMTNEFNRLLKEQKLSFADQREMWTTLSTLRITNDLPGGFFRPVFSPFGDHIDLSTKAGLIKAYELYTGETTGMHVDEFTQKIYELCYNKIQIEISHVGSKHRDW